MRLHLVVASIWFSVFVVSAPIASQAATPRAAAGALKTPSQDGPTEIMDGESSFDVVEAALADRGGVRSVGPDVIVGDLFKEPQETFGMRRWGRVGTITAYSVGTISCNVGTQPIIWEVSTNEHPVIGAHLYRLKDGRFEQIGVSWLKHAFFALSQNLCFSDCQPTDGSELGVHCSDPYTSSLNGQQNNLGPRNQVNAASGVFPYPWTAPGFPGTIGRRLQVQDADLHPPSNVGALYFVEGEYVTADDAQAGNNRNNSSYRRMQVVWSGGGSTTYNLDHVPGQGTHRESPGIFAWRDVDPAVQMNHVDIIIDGRVTLASRATDLGGGQWHYEYALYNMNSDRCVGTFTVPIPSGTTVTNIGFHDITYHSHGTGNQSFYDGTDWPGTASSCSVTWATTPFTTNQNANAVRWGTTYNFRFDANRAPGDVQVTLGLFKTGTPGSVTIAGQGPVAAVTQDCNNNGKDDAQDISCGTSGDCDLNSTPDECQPDCDADSTPNGCEIAGGAPDCDGNSIPDSCELAGNDCNDNGALDSCDIAGGAPDCNGNGRPDSCDLAGNDCNSNGTPDSCDIAGGAPDCDSNGRPDSCDLAGNDCDNNLVPDTCQLTGNDCNGNGMPDQCDLAGNDCNTNGTLDSCDIAGGAPDCDSNGRPDSCDLAGNDCNTNGRPDQCDLAGNDCNTNGVPDACELAGHDCQPNGTIDSCDIAGGLSLDVDADGRPDECEAPAALVNSAVSRKSCDLYLTPGVTSESRQGGIGEVRIAFNMPPGDPAGSGSGVTVEQKTCAAPTYVPYAGVSVATGSVNASELILYFSPALENLVTYRITVGLEVTSVAGQFCQVRGLVGDANSDGFVNASDRSVVVGAWTGDGFSCPTDIDNDGVTSAVDRSHVVGVWTSSENCAP